MREQLKLLEALQQVDAKLHETEQALSFLPAKLQSMQDDVGRVENLLETERQQLAEVQRYRAEIETGLHVEIDQQNKSKSRLTQVKTSKEYMATQRELEISRKGTAEREEELLKLLSAIEQSERSIRQHEDELKALKQHVADEERETARKIEALRRDYALQRADRDKNAAAVPREMLAKYDSIRQRRANPIVPARNGVCTGCNMHLPPQLFRILQGGTSIEHCPSCHRIVYFEPMSATGASR